WLFGGGFVPGLTLNSGEEQSAKTTALYDTLATSMSKLKLPYNMLYDAEGSVSKKYTANIWTPFALDVEELISEKGRAKGFYYYRDQVIERMFDLVKQRLMLIPHKNWNNDSKTWCY